MVVQLSPGPLRTLQIDTLVGVATFYYSFFLTLDEEVRLIWRRKISIVSALVFAIRYITFIAYIPTIIFLFDGIPVDVWAREVQGSDALELVPPKACSFLLRFPGIVGVVCNAFVLTLLVIRTYAIYGNQTRILFVILPLGIACIAGGFAFMFELGPVILLGSVGSPFVSQEFACLGSEAMNSVSVLLYRLSCISNILFGTTVIVLTLARSIPLSRQMGMLGQNSRLMQHIMMDGTMFYLVITALDLIQHVMFETELHANTGPPSYYVSNTGGFSEISHSLSVTLMSQMVFNLREEGTVSWEDVISGQARSTFDATQRSVSAMRFTGGMRSAALPRSCTTADLEALETGSQKDASETGECEGIFNVPR